MGSEGEEENWGTGPCIHDSDNPWPEMAEYEELGRGETKDSEGKEEILGGTSLKQLNFGYESCGEEKLSAQNKIRAIRGLKMPNFRCEKLG